MAKLSTSELPTAIRAGALAGMPTSESATSPGACGASIRDTRVRARGSAVVESGDSSTLLARVMDNLRARCLVQDGARLLVGVSGGCDSVSLLLLLAAAAPAMHLDLVVAHFDHRLRPDSSDDARFVRELSRGLGVAAHVGVWEMPARGEEAARRARHEFLQRTALRLGCTAVALGHQAEDQAETVLMRLARGTGVRGLAGMAWRRSARVDLVRPLLDFRRRVLAAYLRSAGQSWREDPTNSDLSRTRNRIRHVLLPALESTLGASWIQALGQSLDEIRLVWNQLAREAGRLLDEAGYREFVNTGTRVATRVGTRARSCDLQVLRRAPEPVLRTALQMWFEDAGCTDLTRSHLAASADLIRNGQSGQCVMLPREHRLLLEQGRALLMRAEVAVWTHHKGKETSKPLVKDFVLEVLPLDLDTAQTELASQDFGSRSRPAFPCRDRLPDADAALVATDLLTPPLLVRSFREGERVRLLGAPGSRKVARILQDRRVPRRLRGIWPMVADADGIVWIPGIGIAERCRLGATSRRVSRFLMRRRLDRAESCRG